MMYTVRPLTDFTGFTGGDPLPNPFRAAYGNTLKLLNSELTMLDAENVVFEIAVTDADIRLDGMLKSKAKVTHPGVRVAFDSKFGPLTYATDRYQGRYYDDPPDWQINLRAIALGLQALRAVDRYGVTKRGEQYTGFKALPPGRAMPASHMTRTEAEALLSHIVGAFDRSTGRERLRRARAMAHPDRNGGDRTLWDLLEQAAEVLDLVGVTA